MSPRRAPAIVGASVAALLAAVATSAAGLGLVPARLTAVNAASTVAVSTCSLAASSADAYVDGAALQTNSNFGSSTDLSVRSSLLGNRRTFVRFDLSGCAIPSSSRVTGATFNLFLSQAPASSRTYEARRVTAAWVESTVTWANQPGVAGAATATTVTGTTSGVTLSWTVTSDVQAFVAGSTTNHGWRVADGTEGAVAAVTSILRSREGGTPSERPTLVVTYYP